MSELIIRDVVPADIPLITKIYRDAVLHGTASFELDPPDDTEMLARMKNITDSGYPYVIASDPSGILLGYAYASAYRARPAYRWTCENSVYVDTRIHGQGVGKKLMQTIISRCTALGFRQMISVIGGADHNASIALHKKLGFEHVGVLPATGYKHGKWLDSVIMQIAMGDGNQTAPDADVYPGTLYRSPT